MNRLYDKVNKTNTCWIWIGAKDNNGYGVLAIKGKLRKAHRLIYELEVAPIPKDKVCDHICRVRQCVNPSHIELVSNATNVMRGISNAALNARKTRCKQGHVYTPENTRITTRGWRVCRACDNERSKLRHRLATGTGYYQAT